MRALSEKYPQMEPDEKHRLVRLVFFEAAKRYVWALSEKPDAERLQGLKKFELIEKLAVAQEATESGVGNKCKFWSKGDLNLVRIQTQGYEACPAYVELKENSSMEAQYEASTILSEMSSRVDEVVNEIKEDFLKSNPEFQKQQD